MDQAAPVEVCASDDGALDLSIVAPAFNELENLPLLVEEVERALAQCTSLTWELVLVDDGSRDGSARVIRELADEYASVQGVYLERNLGQTVAIVEGLGVSRGKMVATIDADLQNDPADLPALIERLAESGADGAFGVRVSRADTWLRRVSSAVGNGVRNAVLGETIQDSGCALKVFRADALRALPLSPGMHRFLPALMRMHGFEVLEVPVRHRVRVHGRSKYGIFNRLLPGLRDLARVRAMEAKARQAPANSIAPSGRR